MNRENLWEKHKQLLGGLAAVAVSILLGSLLFLLRQHCADSSQVELSTQLPSATTAQATATTETTVTAAPTTTLATEPIPVETKRPKLVHHVTKNHFVAADFTYDEKGYISCTAAPYWLGIDVSVHQRTIDWQQVADAGIQFAMVRIAYRGWGTEGKLRADTRGQGNLDGACAAGLKVGVYIYSQAITPEEAEEEARFVLELLNGRELDLPVVFDWEQPGAEGARTRDMDNETLNACAIAFCKVIQEAGYEPMVYFNQKQAHYQYDLGALKKAGYRFWVAMYKDALTFPYHVQMWQYTSHGKVPGIEGRVDVDLYFPNL